MGLNFDGIGMAIEADSKSAVKNVFAFKDSISSLWEGMSKAGSVAISAGKSITTGMGKFSNMASNAAGSITGMISGIASSASDPKLSAAFDAQFAAFDKSFSAMAAGMKLTEKEARNLKSVGGIAFGLNADMDAAATSVVAFRKEHLDLVKILGAKSSKQAYKDLIKATSVYGVEGQQLAYTMAGLITRHKMTEESAGGLLDKITFIGKHFDTGTEAVKSLNASYESVTKSAAAYGRTLQPEEVDQLISSITMLGGAFGKMGEAPEAGYEVARNLFEAMAGERDKLQGMFVGMEGELGQVSTLMAEMGGDVTKVFTTMFSTDPTRMMDMLGELSVAAKERGGEFDTVYNRILMGLKEAGVDPAVLYGARGQWKNVAGDIEYLNANMDKAKGAFVDTANAAYKTGLTAQDSWERFQGFMQSKWYKLSEGNVKAWTKNMKSNFNETYAVVSRMAADKGPLGAFTNKMLEFSRVGVTAFFPALGPIAPMFAQISQSMFPAMTALGSMGLRLGTIAKFFLPGAALFAGFKLLKEGPEGAKKAFWDFFDSVNKAMGGKLDFLKKGLLSFNLKDFIKGVGEKIKSIPFDKIFGYLAAGFSKASEAVGSVDFAGIANSIIGAIGNIPFDKIGQALWGLMDKALDTASKIDWGKVAGVIVKAFHMIAGVVNKLFDKIDWGATLKKVFSFVGSVALGLIDAIISVFTGGEGDIKDGVEKPLQAGFGSAIVGLLGMLKTIISAGASAVWEGLWSSETIGAGINKVIKMVGAGFAGLMILSSGFRGKMVSLFTGKFFKKTPPLCEQAGCLDTMTGGLGSATSKMGKLGSTAAATGKKMGFFGKMGGGIATAGRGIKSGIGMAGKVIGPLGALMGFVTAIDQAKIRAENFGMIMDSEVFPKTQHAALAGEQAFLGLGNTIDSLFFGIPSMIGNALGISEKDLSNFYHYLVGGFEFAIATIVEGGKFLYGFVKALLTGLGNAWKTVFEGISLITTSVWNTVKIGFYAVAEAVVDKILWLSDKIYSVMTTLGAWIMYPFERLAHEMKSWGASFTEWIFGTEKDPSMLSKLLPESLVKDGRGMAKEWRKSWEEEGGEQFGERYFDALDLKIKKNREAVENLRKSVGEWGEKGRDKSVQNIIDQAGKVADTAKTVATEPWGKIKGAAGEFGTAWDDSLTRIGRTVDANIEASERARELIKEKREDEAKYYGKMATPGSATRKASKTGAEIEGGGKRGGASGLPSESPGGPLGSSDPDDRVRRSLEYNVTTLANNMANFIKDPFKVEVVITDKKLSKLIGAEATPAARGAI